MHLCVSGSTRRSDILTGKGFWLLLSFSSSGNQYSDHEHWTSSLDNRYRIYFGGNVMKYLSKFVIFMLNLFSGTPWLLDVLNGFIAHNNVSSFSLHCIASLLSLLTTFIISASSLLLHLWPDQRVQRPLHLPPVHRKEGRVEGVAAPVAARQGGEWSESNVLSDQPCSSYSFELHQ